VIGYTASELANLISPSNLAWAAAASGAHMVFDGFTLLPQTRAAEATYEQAALAYRNMVSGLAECRRYIACPAERRRYTQGRAISNGRARSASTQARQRMETGDANVHLLLTAQQAYLQALIQMAQAQESRLSDTAALYTVSPNATRRAWRLS
jgi:outer membrane protein TolC